MTAFLGCLIATVFIIVVVGALVALFSWFFMLAWNAVIPGLFGWHSLDFGQAFALSYLFGVISGRQNQAFADLLKQHTDKKNGSQS